MFNRSFLAEVHRGQHVLQKMHCPGHCLPVVFYFSRRGNYCHQVLPRKPHNNPFPVFNWEEKKKKRTKGFFEILLLICVKVAQISKYVAAKSYWKSWGGVGEGFFFLCMRAKCCCFHTVISNWNIKWFSYHSVCRYIDFVLKEDCLKGWLHLFVVRSRQWMKQLLCVMQQMQNPILLAYAARYQVALPLLCLSSF